MCHRGFHASIRLREEIARDILDDDEGDVETRRVDTESDRRPSFLDDDKPDEDLDILTGEASR